MSGIQKRNEMRPEYTKKDLGAGIRGKYYEAYKQAHNLVLLDPEVPKAFPDDKSVNDALRSLLRTSETAADLTD